MEFISSGRATWIGLFSAQKFMAELNKLPRSMLRLATSARCVYTGMDIAEKSSLQYVVCAGQLARDIGVCTRSNFSGGNIQVI